MIEERLEALQSESHRLENALSIIEEERKQLKLKEAELQEEHQNSLRPLQQLQYLTLSACEEEKRQELMYEIGQIGDLLEDWATDKREALKREEGRIEDKQNELFYKRQKLILEAQEQKKDKESTDG